MALTTDPWDATELAAYISEEWTPIVDQEFFAKPVAANFFQDLSAFAQAGSDIFHIPDAYTNAYTVQTQSTQAAEVTTAAPATVDTTMTVNNHVYIADLLGYVQQVQVASQYNLGEVYSKKATGTLVEDFEGDLFALWSSVSTNTVNDTASVVDDVSIRLALEKLETLDVPRDELSFFFHPYSYYAQILAIQKYYDASQAGWQGGSGPVMTGNFGPNASMQNARKGTLFGVPVFTSSKVVNTLLAVRNLLAHKSAFSFAIQTPSSSKIRFQSSNWLANLGILMVWDMINGVAATRETVAVRISGSNAFISS